MDALKPITKMGRWLPAALFAIFAPRWAPAAGAEDSAYSCELRFKKAGGRLSALPSMYRRNRPLAEVDALIDQAKTKHADGMACFAEPAVQTTKRFAFLEKAKAQSEEKLKAAEASRAQYAEWFAVYEAAATLEKKIFQPSYAGHAEARIRDLRARFEAKKADNPTFNADWFAAWISRIKVKVPEVKAHAEAHAKAAHAQEKLAKAVVSQLPDLSPDDAFRLDRIQKALARMPVDSFMVYRGAPGTAHYRPAGTESAYYPDALPKNRPLPKGMPGVIWNRLDRQRVAFVAADGNRYEKRLDRLAPARDGQASWPKKPTSAYFHGTGLEVLGARNAILKTSAAKFAAARRRHQKCVDTLKAAGERKADRIDEQNLTWHTKEARKDRIWIQTNRNIDRKCTKYFNSVQQALKNANRAWDRERKKTFRATMTRLGAA